MEGWPATVSAASDLARPVDSVRAAMYACQSRLLRLVHWTAAVMLIPNVSLSVATGMRVARASNAALRPRMARMPFSAILPASLPASRRRPGRGLGKR